jgi:hypothetical protein
MSVLDTCRFRNSHRRGCGRLADRTRHRVPVRESRENNLSHYGAAMEDAVAHGYSSHFEYANPMLVERMIRSRLLVRMSPPCL